MATPFPFQANAVLTAAELNAITTLPINDQTASYVLVAGDVGKRVVMDVAGANTVTVNTGTFGTGDMVFIMNKGAGTSTITAGAGVTINTTGSLALSQYGGGTLLALSATVFNFFPSGGIGYGTATGGSSSSITVSGVNYTLLTFTTSGTLTVTKSGLFDVMLVGGGGSGGLRTSTNVGSGGGGGGAVIQQTIYLDANATVTVGAKGAAQTTGNNDGNRGTFSKVANFGAGGGGGGAGGGRGDAQTRLDGGGSGGGSFGSTATNNETPGQALVAIGANNGGNGGYTTNLAGGGGGGSTQVGQDNSGNTAGNGGTGTDVSAFISGSALYHGAGGGGGSVSGTGGTAGNSTGGNGGSSSAAGSNATATNYGCGGGGGAVTQGGAGSDGVVYVRFKV